MKKLVLIGCLFLLASCDPGWALYLENNSGKDKEVMVVGENKRSVTYMDSILIADTFSRAFDSTTTFRNVAVVKDAVANAYRFTLAKGKTAVLDHGIGKPCLADLLHKIIIDKSDTLEIKKDKRVKSYPKFMSTAIVATLK